MLVALKLRSGGGALCLGRAALFLVFLLRLRTLRFGGRRILRVDRDRSAGLRTSLAEIGVAEHAAGAAGRLRNALRGEVVGDAALLFGRRAVDEPHKEEEGHHRGHEVGIRDFPGAAMVSAMTAFLDLLDDDGAVARHAALCPNTRSVSFTPRFFPRWRASPSFWSTQCPGSS